MAKTRKHKKTSTPPIVERLVFQLMRQGYDKRQAFAIATSQLQKAGVLRGGTKKLTSKGRRRQKMSAKERAISRHKKRLKSSGGEFIYSSKTNRTRRAA